MLRFRLLHLLLLILCNRYAVQQTILTAIHNKCITSTSQAMSWIYNISNVPPQIQNQIQNYEVPSQFSPLPNNSLEFKCDWDESCRNWVLVDSTNVTDVPNLITDRRWEDFPMFATTVTDIKETKLEYLQILKLPENDFDIAFSLRIMKEAHIFLCESEPVYRSKCYWFLLGAWNGEATAFRECKDGNIQQTYDGKAPTGICNNPTLKMQHAEHFPLFMSDVEWSHLRITKIGELFSLMKEAQNLFQIKPEKLHFQPKFMYIHSKRNEGLWKLHKFNYLYSNMYWANQRIYEWTISFSNQMEKHVCLAIFLVMCKTCQLNIEIIDTNNNLLYTQRVDTRDERWIELKITLDFPGEPKGKFRLQKITNPLNKLEPLYWAIDKPRICLLNELRVLMTKKQNPKCILMGTKAMVQVDTASEPGVLAKSEACSENQFGETCLDCSAVFNDSCPKRTKYCQLHHYDTEAHCYCTIGYMGAQCQEVCQRQKYGHGCQKSCYNCQNSCSMDNIFGHCDTEYCTDNYSGKKCDIPVGIFIFKNPPIMEPNYTTCRISMKSMDGRGQNPHWYIFQYKPKGQNNWTDTEPIQFNDRKPIMLQNLEINRLYDIRVVGYANKGDLEDIKQMQNNIETYQFRTKCKDILSSDIELFPAEYSVNYNINMNDSLNCPKTLYNFVVNDTVSNDGHLEGLHPFTMYNFVVTIKSTNAILFLKIFRTKETTPGSVADFRYNLTPDPSIVDLNWDPPKKPNGVILGYTISYKIDRHMACPNRVRRDNVTIKYFSATEVKYRLKDLLAFSIYSVEIKANTSIGYGPSLDNMVVTNSLDRIARGEIEFKDVQIYSTRVTFLYSLAECELIKGPIYANLSLSGMSFWCSRSITKQFNITWKSEGKLELSGLDPYCNYTYQIQIYRSDNFIDITNQDILQTKPVVSERPTDLDVTSKGADYVALRWKPPYPPTGEIETYELCYYCYYYASSSWYCEKSNKFAPTTCRLWPEYHCYKIEKLQKSYYHNFQLRMKNKIVRQYSEPAKLGGIVTEEEKPEKPYGLSINWTDENYMELSWYHPNRTNGRLTDFVVNVNDATHIYPIVSEEQYTLKYNHKISEGLTFPSLYTVSIKAKNRAGLSQPATKSNIDSPPPLPIHSTQTSTHNGNITIQLGELLETTSFQRYLYILISEFDTNAPSKLKIFSGLLSTHHQNSSKIKESFAGSSSWQIMKAVDLNSSPPSVVHVDYEETKKYVSSNTNYNISLVWVYKNKEYVRTYIEYCCANISDAATASVWVYVFSILTLFVVVLVVVYLYLRYQNLIRNNTENNLIPLKDVQYANQEILEHLVSRPNLVKKPDIIVPGTPLFKTENSHLIRLENFAEYLKTAILTNELKIQHELFPRGLLKPCEYGAIPENKTKNRYNNLIAYDASRVHLKKINDDPYSDYINANFIDGYRMPKAYIATQGPKKHTVYDFWRMILQENVSWIIIVANVIEGGKKKTEQYWPNTDEELVVEDLKIVSVKSELYAGYEYRSFALVKQTGESREIGQLHFKAWPDHGVPLYPQTLVPFLQKMLTLRSGNFPIVVHCSAGVGRTGTIILCDLCLRMAASEGTIDALAMLEHLRNQRPNMVDNVEQYKLAHLVILNCLEGMRTEIPTNKQFCHEVNRILEDNLTEYQLNYIRECEWQDDSMKTIFFDRHSNVSTFPEKDRFPEIQPERHSRVFLYPYPPADPAPSSVYINAIRVDGYGEQGRYLVTSYPLPDYIGDFWRLIIEQNVYVVVCLNEINSHDQTCKCFWPKGKAKMSPTDFVTVTHLRSSTLRFYTVMTFEVKTTPPYMEEKTMTVEIIKFKGWKISDQLPEFEDFISLTEDVIKISKKSTPALISCYDGATASGLLIAMSFLIEKINLEQECDVCQAIRSIRTSRKEFTNTREQIEFLYRACMLYVEEKFSQYSNMDF